MASKFRSTSWCNNDCLGEKPGLQEFVTVQVILKYALAQKATKWVHTGIGSVKSHCTQTLEAHVTCFVSILGKNIHAVTVTHLQTACTLLYHEHVSWHSQVAQIFFPVNAMVYEFVQARVPFSFFWQVLCMTQVLDTNEIMTYWALEEHQRNAHSGVPKAPFNIRGFFFPFSV